MARTVEIAYAPGSYVIIDPLKIKGMVDRVLIRRGTDVEYCVQYWKDGTKHEAWCRSIELSEA